jgi:hypothetical protein
MAIIKLNKPAGLEIDVDGCLLENESGDLNKVILGLLADNKDMISSCGLITGRDIAGIGRTLTNHRDITADILKANGLGRVKEEVEKVYGKEIVVCTTRDLVGNNIKPGDYYSSYGPIEAAILDANTSKEISKKLELFKQNDLSWITDKKLLEHANKTIKWDSDFEKITSKDGYNLDLLDKGPQVKFYLGSLEDSVANSAQIYIDDVPSKVKNVAKENPKVIAVHVSMEMGKGYNEQALNFAISAANGDKKSHENLKEGLIKYEELENAFNALKDLKMIDIKDPMRDLVEMAVKDGDWFKAVKECIEPLNNMVIECRTKKNNKAPEKEIKESFIKSYDKFKSDLGEIEFKRALALSLKVQEQDKDGNKKSNEDKALDLKERDRAFRGSRQAGLRELPAEEFDGTKRGKTDKPDETLDELLKRYLNESNGDTRKEIRKQIEEYDNRLASDLEIHYQRKQRESDS